MYKKQAVIKNKLGIHARPAAEFAALAAKYDSDIEINVLGSDEKIIKNGPAKSIVSVMSFGLSQGARIEITADGSDEREAVNALLSVIESGFGED